MTKDMWNEYEVLTKDEIFNGIRKNVSGQDAVLHKLSFIAHLYAKKVLWVYAGAKAEDCPKINFLLTGPTGFGKTFIVKNLAETLNTSYYRIDCSTITGEGWKGSNVTTRLAEFVKKSPDGIGILHLDEFDKLAISPGSDHVDMYTDKQISMLDILDGIFTAGASDNPSAPKVDTSVLKNTFVIMSGSFQKHRDEELAKKANIGFTEDKEATTKKLVDNRESNSWRSMLVDLGFLPEVANRIVASEELDRYSKEQIRHILLNTEGNALAKHKNLKMKDDSSYTDLTDEQIDSIVDRVHESESGMRELDVLIFDEIYKNFESGV